MTHEMIIRSLGQGRQKVNERDTKCSGILKCIQRKGIK